MSSTRERIVAATTNLFRQRGYNGTSLKMIIDAAGTTNGSLYHFFPGGKDDLAAAVVRESGAAYLELFELYMDGPDDILTALTSFFEGGSVVLEETEFIDPCPIGTIAREVASVNEPLRLATQRVFRSWIDAASERLDQAGVDPGRAQSLATCLVAIIEGGFVLSRAARNAAPLRACGEQAILLVSAQLGQVAEHSDGTPGSGARSILRESPTW